jgi:hypothetical protein
MADHAAFERSASDGYCSVYWPRRKEPDYCRVTFLSRLRQGYGNNSLWKQTVTITKGSRYRPFKWLGIIRQN